MFRAAILAFAASVLAVAIYVMLRPPEPVDVQAQRAAAKRAHDDAAAPKHSRPGPVSDAKRKPIAGLQPGPVRAPVAEVVDDDSAVARANQAEPGRVQTQDEAVVMYEGFLAKLAEAEGRNTPLSQAQKDKLYHQSADVLAGLSEQINPNDPDQMQYLEGARGMILAQLRRMKIGPPEPPMRKPKQIKGRPGL